MPGSSGARFLRRWRERLIALGVAGAGLALLLKPALAGAPVPTALLAIVIAFSIWLFRDAARRGRLRGVGEGPGVAAVREGMIAYFGPRGGGAADLDAIASIAIAPGPDGPVWLLRGAGGDLLRIPLGAEGAGDLPDVFAALPGFDAGRIARALSAEVETLVWIRGPAAAATPLSGPSGPPVRGG
jgi:hypothetical protein